MTVDPDLLPLDEVIARSDILILCTPHGSYKTADLKGKPVVDVWGMLAECPNTPPPHWYRRNSCGTTTGPAGWRSRSRPRTVASTR